LTLSHFKVRLTSTRFWRAPSLPTSRSSSRRSSIWSSTSRPPRAGSGRPRRTWVHIANPIW